MVRGHSLTTVQIQIEQIVPWHEVPSELVSERGAAFLSKVDVYTLLAAEKVSTTTNRMLGREFQP